MESSAPGTDSAGRYVGRRVARPVESGTSAAPMSPEDLLERAVQSVARSAAAPAASVSTATTTAPPAAGRRRATGPALEAENRTPAPGRRRALPANEAPSRGSAQRPVPTRRLDAPVTAQPVAKPAPAPVAKPTPAPVAKPTPTPVAKPTPAPVAKPAPAPVAKPTPAPVAARATAVRTPIAVPLGDPLTGPLVRGTEAAAPAARPATKPTKQPTKPAATTATHAPAAPTAPIADPLGDPLTGPLARTSAPAAPADDHPHGRAAELLADPVEQHSRVEEAAQVGPTLATQRPLFAVPTPTVELPTLAELTGELPRITDSTTSLRPASPGKRRAGKSTGSRTPLLRGLPALPVAAGVATLAVAVGGAVTTADTALVSNHNTVTATNALSGSYGSGSYDALRVAANISRDSDRDALEHATDAELVDEAEKVAEQRDAALGELAADAEKEAQEIASLNRWELPISPGAYRLTATYGEYGLWSSYHTGLDFAAPTGTSIRAVASGVITSVGYDGAYGNKTVLTLEDGTEIWFCHQTSYNVSVGDVVQPGETIGYVGSTGHVTGPHLHLEVRPGAGDPVDPYAALKVHGLTP
ncbi:peptidoglycan DD-metalloendopeptidase family protein [Nocardioides sp. YIM 152588]|uniref:M23 family metallopeptidase n=1 Tax=Nocardioides sp. YIM 152588 TaxID=3158259 RepID=UPI0032E40E78